MKLKMKFSFVDKFPNMMWRNKNSSMIGPSKTTITCKIGMTWIAFMMSSVFCDFATFSIPPDIQASSRLTLISKAYSNTMPIPIHFNVSIGSVWLPSAFHFCQSGRRQKNETTTATVKPIASHQPRTPGIWLFERKLGNVAGTSWTIK